MATPLGNTNDSERKELPWPLEMTIPVLVLALGTQAAQLSKEGHELRLPGKAGWMGRWAAQDWEGREDRQAGQQAGGSGLRKASGQVGGSGLDRAGGQ